MCSRLNRCTVGASRRSEQRSCTILIKRGSTDGRRAYRAKAACTVGDSLIGVDALGGLYAPKTLAALGSNENNPPTFAWSTVASLASKRVAHTILTQVACSDPCVAAEAGARAGA